MKSVSKFLLLPLVLGFLLCVASASHAVISETNVQGSSRTGGDRHTIRGRNGRAADFTVMGAFNDVVIFRLRNGHVVGRFTLRDLATKRRLPGNLKRLHVVKYRDGQTRVYLRSSASIQASGGTVEIRRGRVIIDQDRIRIRH